MERDSKIYVAGHRGLVGAAIVARLQRGGYHNLLLRTHAELDLTDQAAVRAFLQRERPEYLFLAAAKVGGIHANASYPMDFIAINLAIELNLITAARECGVKRLLFLGSSCIYPRDCPQPIREEYLLTGPLEATNEPYAVAKIAGIKLCEASNRQHGTEFVPVMPTNLYGPNDNFDLHNSHVLPAMIRRFHEAVERGDDSVVVWGTGTPRREFLHVDDMADACVFLMNREDHTGMVNIGVGEDLTIAELAQLVAGVVGFGGRIEFDTSKPDGTPRKLLDVSRLHALGWRAGIDLRDGIRQTYDWFLQHRDSLRG
ncbi:MAG TPA: GDP-L-fucose synthase [Sedimenticola thiotaurini]|uniref:GDP-L-fucose synthase n=1 Tax=Sedimenticola thiotaurini TaxID=1543721 RepID=A0A831W9S7_9GAMM|nr:GDP-L-fucose synthase [Sedimenticola thiotaurini]